MSLLNNSNKKQGKGGKSAAKQPAKAGFIAGKGKANTKGVARNTKLTGGSQRGS